MSAADVEGGVGTQAASPGDRHTALRRAVDLLARREHSQRELMGKLVARGIAADTAAAVVDRLARQGWQDEARFAATLARTRASAGYGPLRIRAELAMHGLRGEQVAAALAACETDWREAAHALVARRFPVVSLQDPKQRRKAIELLMRRGFDRADAFAAVYPTRM